MRITSARKRAGWLMASRLMDWEGTQRRIPVGSPADWIDVVRLDRPGRDPVVLIPGLAGGWKLLAPLAERLAKRHDVVICGLRGDCFPSGGRCAEEISDHADDVAEVLNQLGLERPTVMGVSFGGAVALELAVNHPSTVGALIVQGAEARFRTTVASTIARRVLERFPLPADSGFVNQFFNLLHGSEPKSGPLAEFVIDRCWETDQWVMAKRLSLLETFDVSERLWQIDVPTLVVAGTRDVVVPIARQQALAQAIPGARFARLEGAGHIGFLTHRRELALEVSNLLRQLKQTPC